MKNRNGLRESGCQTDLTVLFPISFFSFIEYEIESKNKTNIHTDVIHVMVKYNAVTYIVFFDGPFIISGVLVSFIHTYEYGLCVTFANFHSQLYWTCDNKKSLHFNPNNIGVSNSLHCAYVGQKNLFIGPINWFN